jgi:hypothetical protein
MTIQEATIKVDCSGTSQMIGDVQWQLYSRLIT